MLASIQNNNPSFTSRPFCNVNLKRVSSGVHKNYTQAVISTLSPKSEIDKVAVDAAYNNWTCINQVIRVFRNDFLKHPQKHDQYLALELKGSQNLADRIVGFVKSHIIKEDNQKKLCLSFLVTKPEFMRWNSERTAKGLGEVMLGEAFCRAKKLKVSSVKITSVEHDFYNRAFEHAGIDIVEGENFFHKSGEYHIKAKDFDKYIDYCQKEYKTKLKAKF